MSRLSRQIGQIVDYKKSFRLRLVHGFLLGLGIALILSIIAGMCTFSSIHKF